MCDLRGLGAAMLAACLLMATACANSETDSDQETTDGAQEEGSPDGGNGSVGEAPARPSATPATDDATAEGTGPRDAPSEVGGDEPPPDDDTGSPGSLAAEADGRIRFIASSTVASEKTNTPTLDVESPPGIEPGDVVVAQVFSRSEPTALNQGWELLDTENLLPQSVWTRVVAEEEPLVYTWIQSDPERLGRSGVVVAAYRGVDPDRPVVAHDYQTEGGPSRELVTPSVEVGSEDLDGAMVIRMWSTQATGEPDDEGIQPSFGFGLMERGRVSSDTAARAVLTMADSTYDGSGPTGEAVGTTIPESERGHGHTVVLRPLR